MGHKERKLDGSNFKRRMATVDTKRKIIGWDIRECPDQTFAHNYERTITLYVHQGSTSLTFSDGETVKIQAGGTLTLQAGASATWAVEPTIDAFAEKAMVFENHFISGLPSMPTRREIFAEHKECLWRLWGALRVFDDRMPVIPRQAGDNTGIVDNPIDGRVGKTPDPPVGQDYYDPTVPLPMWKLLIEIDARTPQNFLYHRAEGPAQTNNLWDASPDQRDRMLDLMRRMIKEDGAPPEQFVRLGLD